MLLCCACCVDRKYVVTGLVYLLVGSPLAAQGVAAPHVCGAAWPTLEYLRDLVAKSLRDVRGWPV